MNERNLVYLRSSAPRASQQSTIDSRIIEMHRGPAANVARLYAVYSDNGFYGATPVAE